MAEFVESGYIVAIVGATGAVGREIVQCLHARRFPLQALKLFVSERSAGSTMATPFGDLPTVAFSIEEARKCHFAFLAVSGDFALEFARRISDGDGPVVIDNSSAFRLDPDVPLVVPEINGDHVRNAKLIANPNCTTAIAAVVLWPLHQRFRLRKLIVSTYQAASGAGAEGMAELIECTGRHLRGETPTRSVFAHPLPFNLIPHIDKFLDNGYTKEEMKVVWETRKIFVVGDEVSISCTAVRVPTLRAHAESITIETDSIISSEEARAILSATDGVLLADDTGNNRYPMPLTASGREAVEVGRIRQSLVFGSHGLDMFICGDQLLRGAALNAVLIAERVVAVT